ncbi:MAG TPA: protein kinase [Myxococcaceae bacterium]|nr:protein kinase [Myxococcaceae bacterium]
MIWFWLHRQFPAGTMIDGWKVVRPLGGGGFGVVLLVEREGQRYALKVALRRKSRRDDKRTHERTERELAMLLMLDHPHIIKTFAYGRWGDPREGHLYFVMDYVEGWTLAEWVKRKHVTFREIIRVFRKLASALAYLHAKRMFHRDLKLVNVVVSKRTGEPVLIDFGCATHAHAEELTDFPAPPGTPSYQPPQIARFLKENRNKPGARYPFQVADELFSLGVMLYEVLTEPRPTQQSARPLLNSLWRPPPPPHQVNPRVPEGLSSLVMELLAREPEHRPEGAETLGRELAELEAHKGPEYDETAHLPSAQRTPLEEEESNVVPLPSPPPRGLAALWARVVERARGVAARVLRWHKRLAVGGAVAAVGLLAVLTLLALWPSQGTRPALPPAAGASSGVSAPSAGTGSPPLAQPVASVPTAPTEVQKEGPPVTPQQPDAPKPLSAPHAQKPQRGVRSAEFLAWCKSFAIVGTVTAVASGCPGAQVRPEPFQCPEGAWELMDEKWGWDADGMGIRLLVDDRYKIDGEFWLQSGPVVGVVVNGPQQPRSKKPVPVGTRFIGHQWVVPEPNSQGPAHLVVRYDRVEFPNGENAPVCLLVGGDRTFTLAAVKDGAGQTQTGLAGYAYPVYRWKPGRRE